MAEEEQLPTPDQTKIQEEDVSAGQPVDATLSPLVTMNDHEADSNSPIQTSDKMEVHHSAHVHHNKKWKDYVYEFLMLFLAVTAGFFAENQREHYIENKRAEQFSKQLLSDLRLDSILFENRKRDLDERQKLHRRLLSLLTAPTPGSDRDILESLLHVTYAYDLPVTTTTYNQMKSSGSLRYIDNATLTASLQNYYDVLLPKYDNVIDASLNYFIQYVNPFYLKHIRVQDYDSFSDTLINKESQILDRTRQTDQELANIMGSYHSLLKIQSITMNDPALAKIKEVILLLKSEFRLE